MIPGSERAALVLMGGGPGSGKTRIARELVRRLPTSLWLDKDLLSGRWVDQLLLVGNAGVVDRDSPYYWQTVRPLEYATLEAVAFAHLTLGKSVVIDAPLAPELNDAAWVTRMREACRDHSAELLSVWVRIAPATAYRRLHARGEPRDRWKLAHWEEFLATRRPYEPPAHVSLLVENEDADSPDRPVERILEVITNWTVRGH
jgi:predicted kinase